MLFRVCLVVSSLGSERREQRRRGISEIVKANGGHFRREEQRAEFSRHVSRLVRQPDIDSCRRAGRLLQSQILLQQLRVSRRIGPGQNQRKRREIRLTAGKQSTMIPTRLSPLHS